MNLFEPKKFLFRYKYLETLIITSLYMFIGYLVWPDDICMLKTNFFPTMFLAIITLFHGLASGLLAMTLFGIAMKFAYNEFDYIYFLKELVLVLVFGEFQYLWNRKIETFATELKYTKEKLHELSDAFYTLKLSHDQIERSYVVKPMSLRNALMNIKEEFKKRGKDFNPFEKFLTILSKTIDIQEAFILEMRGFERFRVLAKTKEKIVVDIKDLLIETALAKKMPVYVSMDEKYSLSQYLAVIPAIIENKVYGLLIIQKMPFMSFNKDNLSSSAILLNYIFDEVYKVKIIKRMGSFLRVFDDEFRFEAYRLKNIDKMYKMSSTVLILKVKDSLKANLLKETIQKQIRILDTLSFVKISENLYIIGVIFIFAHKSSMEGFMNRVRYSIRIAQDDEDIKQMIFLINEIEMIEKFIKEG
jgi:hypothetical protein